MGKGVLEADPRQRWQASDDFGLLLLWDEEGGWAGAVSSCPRPECACLDAVVEFVRVPHGLRRVEDDGRTMAFVRSAGAPDIGDSVMVRVDPATGHARLEDEGEDGDETASNLARWLEDNLDGRVLDGLFAFVARAKGIQCDVRHPEPRLGDWAPGHLLAYDVLLAGSRQDVFLCGDRAWMAVDQHCVTPACRCRDLVLGFYPYDDPDKDKDEDEAEGDVPALDVSITLPAGRDKRWREAWLESDDPLLEALWAAYKRRHPDVERVRSRRQRVRQVARETLATHFQVRPAAAAKIGRNARCPCGSGVKFKRCCGR